jgi:hypothetical protein
VRITVIATGFDLPKQKKSEAGAQPFFQSGHNGVTLSGGGDITPPSVTKRPEEKPKERPAWVSSDDEDENLTLPTFLRKPRIR